MSFDHIRERIDSFFTDKVKQFGPTHCSVDWKSNEAQEAGFEQILKIVRDPSLPFSIIDFGCGYGAMADYLERQGRSANYTGFDLSQAMIDAARQRFGESATRRFVSQEALLTPMHYVVAGGIFNMKQEVPDKEWHAFMEQTVDQFDRLSTKGFSFNVLTLYSDVDRRRPDLHYADPLFWFDRCKRKYSSRVALLHDYPLWEFTILVRKDV